ncbi:HD domain-containing protein [Paeniglutamicibacter antarcticus]|uniref:HD domain-containing protein n=1 Tax=Paeniglutamicibacter antarcticus TaxID=494023 RepID=A0ABP9THG6_9MICC
MTGQGIVQLAEDIAREAHKGQLDKAGVEYIAHPERVAEGVRTHGGGDEAVAAAWLHDVLEDCPATEAGLREQGIPDSVIETVLAVTKLKNEPVEAYCARVVANPTALRVKQADLNDNTDPARTALLPEEMRTRLSVKYAYVRSLLGLPRQV